MKKIISIMFTLVLAAAMTYSIAALTGEWGTIGTGSNVGNSQGSSYPNNQGGYYPNIPNPVWTYNNPDEDDVYITDDDDSDDVNVNDDDDDTDEVSADDDNGGSDSIIVEDPIESIVTDCE